MASFRSRSATSASRAVTKKEIDTLMRDANLIGNRLTALESEIKLMPSADQYHDLKVMVVEVRGGMATISESIKPIARSVQRIDEFLMNAAQDGRSSRR